MSYPPDPNNPYSQQPPQQPGYGYPQQPPAPGFGAPQDGYGVPPQGAPGYGVPPQGAPGYGMPPQGPYGNAAAVQSFYAGWGSRVAALLIDGLVLVPGYIVAGIGAGVGASSCTTDPNTFQQTCSGGGFGMVLAAVGYLIVLAIAIWQLYREGTTGQTIGKKLVNIRVVREADGQPLGFGMAFVRKLCHILDEFACCIGFLWPLWDAKKQTFADKIMSSVVVKS